MTPSCPRCRASGRDGEMAPAGDVWERLWACLTCETLWQRGPLGQMVSVRG